VRRGQGFENTRLGGSVTTRLNRRDFGLIWNETLDGGGLLVGDEVAVTIDIEFVKAMISLRLEEDFNGR
jgi:polyisoprenoid-binding protein YceI